MERRTILLSAAALALVIGLSGCGGGGGGSTTPSAGINGLAFSRSSGLARMKTDGTNVVPIPNSSDAQNPTMSRDGDVVAMAYPGGLHNIYLFPANGGARKLVLSTGNNTNHPNISVDGSRIVFIQERSGNRDIYSVNRDGLDEVRLTTDLGWDSEPAISKDGSKVAFCSFRNGPNDGDIYSVKSDGSGEKRLTNTLADDDETPAWSPDGSKIVFARFTNANSDNGNIYIMNADGTNIVQLTNTADNEYSPSFSIDGSRIYFSVENKGGASQGIASCRPNGSDYKVIDNIATDWKSVGWVY